MASFETDLARYLAAYERDEAAAEVEENMMSENSDYAVNGENARFLPPSAVLDAGDPVFEIDRDNRFVCLPGVDGDTRCKN